MVMTFEMNLLVSILLIVALAILLFIRFFTGRKDSDKPAEIFQEKFTLEEVLKFVKKQMNEISNVNLYNLSLSEEEFLRQSRRRTELKEALKKCNTGDVNNKTYVKEFMYELLLQKYGFTDELIELIIPFQNPKQMTDRDQFDTLLFVYHQKYKTEAMVRLMKEFKLDQEKEDGGYRVTSEEVRLIYKKKVSFLSFEDKLRIITQRVYSHYKGFGVIDELRDMKIDGISGGVSGLPKRLENFDDDELWVNRLAQQKQSFNSVWFMFQGKTIHLSFLSFETEAELRRIVQNVYKYNYPGQLSESRPYMINEMADGSRVVVTRPKFAESWAFFIRKFDNSTVDINKLIVHENKELVIDVMKFLMAGNRTTAITGSQGSGKTTLLMALIQFIVKSLTLRIQETSFELNLRKLFPDRNILSFQETDNVSGQEGLDLQKKTDGAVNIIGEVASAPVAAWMVQTAQVASLFTLFSHHGKTLKNVVYDLRNSLLKAGRFSNESIAEEQVVSVLEFDIHLVLNYDGTRYIERLTECIPVDTKEVSLPPQVEITDEKELQANFYKVATKYFTQATQQQKFREQNIVEFRDGRYVAVHPISKERTEAILKCLPKSMHEEFQAFTEKHWKVSA